MRFVFAVLLAAVCFGTTGTAQALGPDASAASVGAARIVIGGGGLAVVAILLHVAGRRRGATGTSAASTPGVASAAGRAPGIRPRALPAWTIVLVGAVGVLAYQPAFFAGTAANGVAVGTVVALGSAPVITGALDWLLSRRYPGHRWLLATAIATLGVVVLAAADEPGRAAADPLGLLASLGAAASYAVYTLAAKALLDRGWSPGGSMGALFGVAALVSVPVLLGTDAAWLTSADGLAMALWLGLVTTTLAYVLFGIGLRGLAPATVSTLTLAEPLTAGLLGVLLLGETLAPMAILGLAVLAAGIVVLATGGTRARRRREPARGAATAPMSPADDSVSAWTSFSSPDSGSTAPPGNR